MIPTVRGIVALNIVMLVTETISIIVRFWSRAVTPNVTFWWDDWAALTTWPFAVALQAGMFSFIRYGLGKPVATLPLEDVENFLRYYYVGESLFAVTITLPKISAMLLYVRIFGLRSNLSRAYRMCWKVVFGLIVAWFVTFFIFGIAQCIPISKNWDPTIPGHCVVEGLLPLLLPSVVSDAVIDVLVLVLPMPLLWRLQMDWSKKVGATIGFVLGYGVVIGSLGRMISTIILDPELRADETLHAPQSFYWNTFQPGISIIAINMPPILQLVKRAYTYGLSSLLSARDFSRIPLIDESRIQQTSGVSHAHSQSDVDEDGWELQHGSNL